MGTPHPTRIETRIFNPGIADRLEQDISGFSNYGFEFKRWEGAVTENGCFGVFYSHRLESLPCAVLTIRVPSNVALLSSIGPFLRTLVRLCVDPIDPRSLHTIVRCDPHGPRIDARTMAHGIHMLLRNSMGAALFLPLTILLPNYLSRDSILECMQQNDNGCYQYPTVPILEDITQLGLITSPLELNMDLSSEKVPMAQTPISPTCLQYFDPTQQHLSLTVSTRMCTLRLMPVLYHLANKLLLPTRPHPHPQPCTVPSIDRPQESLWFVCLEKLSNLYRVLMLVRDYGGVLALGSRLVVVVKCAGQAQEFRQAATGFIAENFSCPGVPLRVVTIDQAAALLHSLASEGSVILAFDLHPQATTLGRRGSDAILDAAGAIVWGFESDGIPHQLDALVTNYLQIESRTSVNVIAAVSILLHVLYWRSSLWG